MYAIYLRKSREDVDAERRGAGDTLARHEAMLTDLARRNGYLIGGIYREVVSGETISGRPEMQRLLRDVENERWEGVLVTEVTRLARGDTIDQGVVAQTFKYSGTLIVTPMKVYNPADKTDEEYFEFGLFMSRREYQMINQRLQGGRIRAVAEGKYPANKAPYGYCIVKLENHKGNTLEIVPEQAEIVRKVFEWYTSGIDGVRLGTTKIAHRLNELCVPTAKGTIWTTSSIQGMLHNPTYTGKVRWNGRKQIKKMKDGEVICCRPRSKPEDCILVDGLHKAIITQEMFDLAQKNLESNRPAPVPRNKATQNPLSGIMVCGKCGRKMVRRPFPSGRVSSLICPIAECSNVSSDLEIVERKVIDSLANILKQWTVETKDTPIRPILCEEQRTLERLNTDIAVQEAQLNRQQDFLERGVYTVEEYLRRKQEVTIKIDQLKAARAPIAEKIQRAKSKSECREILIPRLQNLLNIYWTEPPASRNQLLREIVERIVYTREKGGRWCYDKENFKLDVFLQFNQ